MSRITYGKGNCFINGEGSEIFGVEIRYKGAIEITDKTPDNFTIMKGSDKILILPSNFNNSLTDLFDYMGYIKIISVVVADKIGMPVSTSIHTDFETSDSLKTKAEAITKNSENLNASNKYGKTVKNTIVNKNIIENQHTTKNNVKLFYSDGKIYEGYFHIHTDGVVMTGRNHTERSIKLSHTITTPRRFRRREDLKNSKDHNMIGIINLNNR